jgi:hypothetical protein
MRRFVGLLVVVAGTMASDVGNGFAAQPAVTTESVSILTQFAQGQPGSIGGSVGKQDKSISGDDAISPQPEAKPRKGAPRDTGATAPAKGPQTFENPMSNGMRIDYCQTANGSGCGEPAASMWCQRKGYKRAMAYIKRASFGSAWRQGERTVCTGRCGVLVQVTCE